MDFRTHFLGDGGLPYETERGKVRRLAMGGGGGV